MLINHPTDGATCVFVLFSSNHQAALRNGALYHGTAAICISIELRDRTAMVWRWCSIDVVVDRWRCKPDVEGGGGGALIRSNFFCLN